MERGDSALRKTLQKLAHLDLTGVVKNDSPIMKAHGGYCDVFVGTVKVPSGGYEINGVVQKVAIKRLRVNLQTDRDLAKIVAKELYIWSKLSHPNILPLRGYVMEENYPSIIADWMDNGTIVKYLNKNATSDIETVVLGIARGVEYLHAENIVHSDLKADNVLVSPHGEPLICDFGISRIFNYSTALTVTTTGGIKGSMRWMAPELIDTSGNARPTRESDVWAFGMLIMEILTREVPYAYLTNDAQVLFAILKGELPRAPSDLDDWPPSKRFLWDICNSCWITAPDRRITIGRIIHSLEHELQSKTMHNLNGGSTMATMSSSETPDDLPEETKDFAGSENDGNEPNVVAPQLSVSQLNPTSAPLPVVSNMEQVDENTTFNQFDWCGTQEEYFERELVLPAAAPYLVKDSSDLILYDLRLPYTLAKKLVHGRWLPLDHDDLERPACIPRRDVMSIYPPAFGLKGWMISVRAKRDEYITVKDVLVAIYDTCNERTSFGPAGAFIPRNEFETRALRAYEKRVDEVKAFRPPPDQDMQSGSVLRVDCFGEKYMFGGITPVRTSKGEVWTMEVVADAGLW